MKRFISLLIEFALVLVVAGCSSKTNKTKDDTDTITNKSEEDEIVNKILTLKVNDTEVNVSWLNNDSVNALKELAKDELIINMSKYGGFEQVGSLGKRITSSDTNMTTSPGDIVLYSSNQIVIFYGSNSWSYTKLGHIDLSQSELSSLLGNQNVTITLLLK